MKKDKLKSEQIKKALHLQPITRVKADLNEDSLALTTCLEIKLKSRQVKIILHLHSVNLGVS